MEAMRDSLRHLKWTLCFWRGPERHPVLLEVKDVAALLVILHLRDVFIQSNLCNGARAQKGRRSEDTEERHAGFYRFQLCAKCKVGHSKAELFFLSQLQ